MVIVTGTSSVADKQKQELLLDMTMEKPETNQDESTILNKLQNMSFSAHTIQGKRNHMEDFFGVSYQKKNCDHPLMYTDVKSHVAFFYFGIFDGHGGKCAAEYTRDNLLYFIIRQKDFWLKDDDKVMNAIKNGFADCQEAMLEMMPTWPPHSNIIDGLQQRLPSTAGTTASILFIKNNKYYTGHVGDSRIVLARECPETKCWISHDLTSDHKPELPEEKNRIIEAGGDVRDKLGVHRVVWRKPIIDLDEIYRLENCPKREYDFDEMFSRFPIPSDLVARYISIPFLAIARSLGDFWSINPKTRQYIVSPKPDVSCVPIHQNDKGIILASDGLWNVLYSQLAVRLLQQMDSSSTRNGDAKIYKDIDNFYSTSPDGNQAKTLVDIAYQIWEWRNLKSDNITSVVIKFNDIIGSPINDNENSINQVCRDCMCKYTTTNFKCEMEYLPMNLDHQSITYSETLNPGFAPKLIGKSDFNEEEKRFYSLTTPVARLPPSISNLREPKNYQRLSQTYYRKLTFIKPDPTDGSKTTSKQSDIEKNPLARTVLIARATDDPQDLQKAPARMNKKRKFVRDSSCQATQPLQDFGHSWHEMMKVQRSTCREVNIKPTVSVVNDKTTTTPLQTQQIESANKTKIVAMANRMKTRSKTKGSTRPLARGAHKRASHFLSAITKVRRKKC